MRHHPRMAAGLAGLAALGLALSACDRGAGAPDGDILSNSLLSGGDDAGASVPAGPAFDPGKWFGRWKGPEGTYLDVARHPGGFPRVTLMLKDNLDYPARQYTGRMSGATIRFRRRGEALAIRPGTGAETGFKWLLDKKDCLILIAGREGYCRD